jgi:hypothetical protein
MWVPVAGSVLVAAIVLATRSWLNVVLVVGISGALYVAVLMLFGGLRVDPELLAVRRGRIIHAGYSGRQ